jgi:hypothetical protein
MRTGQKRARKLQRAITRTPKAGPFNTESPFFAIPQQEIPCCTILDCGYVPDMNWQEIVSLAIVGLAAALLVRRQFCRRKFSFEHESHCGCSSASESSNQNSIVFRARKGGRPQVIVKMK